MIDAVASRERERGITGLMRLIEHRFGDVMREESRIVRRGTRGEDDLIHLGKSSPELSVDDA